MLYTLYRVYPFLTVGIHLRKTGFPRIKYPVSSTGQAKAGLIKSRMTKCIKSFIKHYISV
jgi:hypothetical protein